MFTKFDFKFDSPIICTAIHSGHKLSSFVEAKINLNEFERFYEEDPFTDYLIENCSNKIIADFSRFEVDLNRDRNKCVYLLPADAWGLKVRKEKFTAKEMNELLLEYDEFYGKLLTHISELQKKFDFVFVFDVHSYNYRRNDIEADPEKNPEIILGTNNMPEKYMPLIFQIKSKLEEFIFFGRKLDVRINVKFTGGHMSRWIHNNFNNVVSLSVEFKKIFMDENTGELHNEMILELQRAFDSARLSMKDYLTRKFKSGSE